MTSPLPRKRLTTARGRNTPARTAAEAVALVGLALLLSAGPALAQEPGGPTPHPAHPSPSLQPAAPASTRPVAYQPPGGGPRRLGAGLYGEEGKSDYQIQLEPPGLERISRLDSDPELQERIRQETRERDPNDRITFPEEPILSRDVYQGRGTLWPARHEVVEPYFVTYKRLLFEEKNSERYGWDLGVLQPIVSAANFYKDLALLPYHLATDPCRCYDSGTGLCLPGDPVPYLLYPPEISVSGGVAEVGVILALVAIFP